MKTEEKQFQDEFEIRCQIEGTPKKSKTWKLPMEHMEAEEFEDLGGEYYLLD